MEILKSATAWAKAELVSTPFFILFGLLFLAASLGFWQWGKTDLAKAYIIPGLVAGTLLLIVGLGLFFTNKSRITQFERDYRANPSAFVESERVRAENTVKEYKNVVFTAVPLIIATCALGILWFQAPVWRASLITAIAMLVVILLIDGLAHARFAKYQQDLLQAQQELKK